MRRTTSTVARVFLISSVLFIYESFACAQDNKQDHANAAPSGLSLFFGDLKNVADAPRKMAWRY